MSDNISFCYQNKERNCNVYIDQAADPFFIFVILRDKELIEVFSDDITIKTDFSKILPHNNDYAELAELRQCIFDALRQLPEFVAAKQRLHRYTVQFE